MMKNTPSQERPRLIEQLDIANRKQEVAKTPIGRFLGLMVTVRLQAKLDVIDSMSDEQYFDGSKTIQIDHSQTTDNN